MVRHEVSRLPITMVSASAVGFIDDKIAQRDYYKIDDAIQLNYVRIRLVLVNCHKSKLAQFGFICRFMLHSNLYEVRTSLCRCGAFLPRDHTLASEQKTATKTKHFLVLVLAVAYLSVAK